MKLEQSKERQALEHIKSWVEGRLEYLRAKREEPESSKYRSVAHSSAYSTLASTLDIIRTQMAALEVYDLRGIAKYVEEVLTEGNINYHIVDAGSGSIYIYITPHYHIRIADHKAKKNKLNHLHRGRVFNINPTSNIPARHKILSTIGPILKKEQTGNPHPSISHANPS